MTELYRVRTDWTGLAGLPGVTTMYFLDVVTAVASVDTFFAGLVSLFPEGLHLQVENSGDIIEDSTGDLTGAWSADTVSAHTGGSSEAYAAPAGAVVDWMTDTIAHSRRLRGRSFLVPITAGRFQDDGTLSTITKTLIQDSANTLIAAQSTSFVVWHRGTGTDGTNGLVTSARVPDMAAVLRSRRD